MANLIIASTRKSAGKTGLAMGLAQVVDKQMGYIKPLGDRLLYRKKRLWDLDASVLIDVLGTQSAAEELTIGFEQAKLRYMYNETQVLERLDELVWSSEHEGRDITGPLNRLAGAGADALACLIRVQVNRGAVEQLVLGWR